MFCDWWVFRVSGRIEARGGLEGFFWEDHFAASVDAVGVGGADLPSFSDYEGACVSQVMMKKPSKS